jgi:hypothetical protein
MASRGLVCALACAGLLCMAVPWAGVARADDASAVEEIVQVLRQKGLIDEATGDQIIAKQAHAEAAAVSAKAEGGADAKRGFSLTPGGFLEAATIFRSANQNADMGSTFGNTPFEGTANSKLTEFRGSARQSRLSLLAQGPIGESTLLTGYYEMDFLADAPTGNEVESNSFSPRIRQLFTTVDFDNGISFLAGQAWSLMTTSRPGGVVPRQELVPRTIEAQYNVGYNWARQWQLRLTDKLADGLWGAISVENPETTLNVVNPPANVLGFNNSPNAQSPGSQFVLSNTPGANGISTDLAPDLIGKLVWEPGYGHYELKAIGRFFRDRFASKNDYATGAGFGAAAILPLVSGVDLVVQTLDGWGIGRYASGLGADVTLKPDGSIVPITALTFFGGLEAKPNENWDVYTYAGLEYYRQRSFQNGATGVGYGTPGANNSGCESDVVGTCQAQNRMLWQIQPGFWYRFYKGPVGTVAVGMSYSYVYRTTWQGQNDVRPIGSENIVMSSFRYYLP